MKSRAVVVGRFPDYTVREFEVPACGAEGLIVKVAAAPFGRRGLVDLRLDGAMDVMADQDGSIWFSWS